MRLDSRLKLKWLDPTLPAAAGLHFKVVNHCALWISEGEAHVANGLSVFDPRDLTIAVLKRFADRLSRVASENRRPSSLHLQVPPFIAHRLEALNSEIKSMGISTRVSPFLCLRSRNRTFELRSILNLVNVDDSTVILKLLKHMVTELPYINVLDQLSDSNAAAGKILALDPDVVTMDIQMPGKSGIEVVKEVLSERYVPIIMVSSVSLDEGTLVFSALREGAFEYLQKPKAEDKSEFLESLADKVLAAAGSSGLGEKPQRIQPASSNGFQFDKSTLWCLGASTGGTQALTEVFRGLPSRIPPTLVVQHIPPIFSRSFAESVNDLVPFRVKEAENNEPVLEDTVYVAPGGTQMSVAEVGQELRIVISDAPPVNRFKPSVDFLFDSVGKLKGKKVVAGILTGMGKDGSRSLLALKNRGAYTFAQDEATSTVYGMPRAAAEIGAVCDVLPLAQIADGLMSGSKYFKRTA